MNSFRIIKKINELVYQFNLLAFMKIHNVISIIHLKQAHTNFYVREISSLIFIIINEKKHYVIKKILRKKNEIDKMNIELNEKIMMKLHDNSIEK